MAADVEVITLVLGRACDAADVLGIGFQDGDGNLFLAEQVPGCQTGGTGSDNGNGFRMDHGEIPCRGFGG